MKTRYVIVLFAVLAVAYGQSKEQPSQKLTAPETAVAAADSLNPQSDEAVNEQSRTKRAPILLGKALLGGAILGKGALLGAGALGVGALGAGVLGAGLYKSA